MRCTSRDPIRNKHCTLLGGHAVAHAWGKHRWTDKPIFNAAKPKMSPREAYAGALDAIKEEVALLEAKGAALRTGANKFAAAIGMRWAFWDVVEFRRAAHRRLKPAPGEEAAHE